MPDFTEKDKFKSATDEPKTQPAQNQNIVKPANTIGVFIFMFVLFTAIFLGLSSVFNWESVCVVPLFTVYLLFIVGIVQAYNKENTDNENAIAQANALHEAREKYNEFRKQVIISESVKEITYFKCSSKSPIELTNGKHKVYIWKADGLINFFPCAPETTDSISFVTLKINSVPVEQIEYFSKQGEVFRENKISGGGGGGSSIGGAVAGGLIAGEAGAVVGSRKKVNDIKSELITHDTRETFLNYFIDSERHSLFFDNDAFQIFNDLIPEKEFSIVNALRSSEIIKNQVSTNEQKSVTDQLRELAKLRDDRIITENEFNEKKKKLLDKIS